MQSLLDQHHADIERSRSGSAEHRIELIGASASATGPLAGPRNDRVVDDSLSLPFRYWPNPNLACRLSTMGAGPVVTCEMRSG